MNLAVADVLEARLVAVNQHLALRRMSIDPQPGRGAHLEQTEGRVKKNQREMMKRNVERYHLERISYLFKVADPQHTWTRVDVLSFGESISIVEGFNYLLIKFVPAAVFLLCGRSAFSPGFVEVLSE